MFEVFLVWSEPLFGMAVLVLPLCGPIALWRRLRRPRSAAASADDFFSDRLRDMAREQLRDAEVPEPV